MRARDLSSPLKQQFSSSSTAVTLDELNPLGDLKLSVEDGTSDKSDKAAKAGSKLPVAFWDLLCSVVTCFARGSS